MKSSRNRTPKNSTSGASLPRNDTRVGNLFPTGQSIGIFRKNVLPWEDGLGKIPKKTIIYKGKVKKYEEI